MLDRYDSRYDRYKIWERHGLQEIYNLTSTTNLSPKGVKMCAHDHDYNRVQRSRG